MTFKARKRLAIAVLVIGLPLYIVAAVVVVGLFDRPPILLELAIYIGLGVLWVLPLKRLFLGVAREDPDAAPKADALIRSRGMTKNDGGDNRPCVLGCMSGRRGAVRRLRSRDRRNTALFVSTK